MEKPIEISVVSPVYLGEESIEELVDGIRHHVSSVTDRFEIVLVEDRSPDGSWERIRDVRARCPEVRAARLSRNFGQHAAITAGLELARGAYVVVLDCDLQDDPRYIPEMYRLARAGSDVVYGYRRSRSHPRAKNVFARLFFTIYNWLVGIEALHADEHVGAYSLLSRKVVDAFVRMNETHRHYLFILRWLGFSHSYLEVEHAPRPYGKSSYDFRRSLRHAIDGITSQSDRALYLTITVGLGFFITSFLAAGYLVVLYLLHGFREGWTSIVVLILLSTGLILMSLGIIGIYIGKIFDQAKGRPLYVIDEVLSEPTDEAARESAVRSAAPINRS